MSEPTRPGARPIYLAPFGLYSRYMLGAYLRHTVMVSAALMTVALAIDLCRKWLCSMAVRCR